LIECQEIGITAPREDNIVKTLYCP
jgi:hypothetical protein